MKLLDHIVVRSDVANWRMPPPWPIGFGLSSAIVAVPTAQVVGEAGLAKMLLVPTLVMMAWLVLLMLRRLWCDRHPYLPPSWLVTARSTLGAGLVDAALARLQNTLPCDPKRIVRRGDMIEAILAERHARTDACNAKIGVRLSDAAPRL